MSRCQHGQCRTCANFNFKGTVTGKYCKRHAEDGMVNVVSKCCSHNVCLRRPTHNVEDTVTGKYCKQHAEEGMVNVNSKRCSRDACLRQPSFNVEGSKMAKYCKRHADDGMVNVRNKRCLYDSCMKRPSFNFASRQTPVCCKEHAKDGMVNVHGKRCAHDFCVRSPSFNFATRKTPVYCEEHVKNGMVIVGSRACSHDCCMRNAYYNIEANMTPEYCKNHSSEGMVLVRPTRFQNGRRTQEPARNVQTIAAVTADTKQDSGIFNGSALTPDSPYEVTDSGKRPTLELDGIHPRYRVKHQPLEEEQGKNQAEGVRLSRSASNTSSSHALPGHFNDSTVRTAARQTYGVMSKTVTVSPDVTQSGKRVKTEVDVDVMR